MSAAEERRLQSQGVVQLEGTSRQRETKDKRQILKSIQLQANRVPGEKKNTASPNLIRYSQKPGHQNAIRRSN